ncbi:hypothetical protein SAMN05442782_11280 [Streptomyces sp. OK228]|nr:hypothetical protein SAMN05442782_11280 [Streptomyces sp. OK228]
MGSEDSAGSQLAEVWQVDAGQCVEKAAAAPFAPVSFDDFDQPSPGLPFEDSAVLRETSWG